MKGVTIRTGIPLKEIRNQDLPSPFMGRGNSKFKLPDGEELNPLDEIKNRIAQTKPKRSLLQPIRKYKLTLGIFWLRC